MMINPWIWSGLIVLALVAGGWNYYHRHPSFQVPQEEIREARAHIILAQKGQSSTYAGAVLKVSIGYYDSAMSAWKLENSKFFFLRNYDRTRALAREAGRIALQSVEKSRILSLSVGQETEELLQNMKERMTLFERSYRIVPLSSAQRQELANAQLLFHEGLLAYQKENYYEAMDRLNEAEMLMNPVYHYAETAMESYFNSYPNWMRWNAEAIRRSRLNRQKCVIVDKYARRCLLYDRGELKNTFNVELGENWMGDKSYRGDKSTPEGLYEVVKKKSNGDTKYYKALLLNYPNEEDIRRFEQNKQEGRIPERATIGNLIEIHGLGGKGIDWTDGCVALADKDMDQLFKACEVGTEILIVGSLEPLPDIKR